MTNIPLEAMQPIIEEIEQHLEKPNEVQVLLVLNGSPVTGLLAMNVWTSLEGDDAEEQALEMVRYALTQTPIDQTWEET